MRNEIDMADNEFDDEASGLETEVVQVETSIVRPFDPEKIKVKTIPVVVDQVVRRIEHDEIDMSPDFQRLRGVWDQQRKSRLLESLLLKIPLPVFYVAANPDDDWSVVDGLQRFSTIGDFVRNDFPLTKLEYLSHFEGLLFNQLPRPMQRRILETQLIVHVIDSSTPDEVMFNIFSRINTGGMSLNGQEIRNAMNKGPARTMLKTLAESNEFLIATDGKVNPKRMADRECVLRFLAFRIQPWESYGSNDLDSFLGNAMKLLNTYNDTEREALELEFRDTMLSAYGIFRDDCFRKISHTNGRRSPISKALFEAWSVGIARASSKTIDLMIANADLVVEDFVTLLATDTEFVESITYGTGDGRRIRKRFSSIECLINRWN